MLAAKRGGVKNSVRVAIARLKATTVLVAIVESADMTPVAQADLCARIQLHHPTLPIMLVSIEDNGFRAFASFQTGALLALLQLERLTFSDLDLDAPLPDQEVPF